MVSLGEKKQIMYVIFLTTPGVATASYVVVYSDLMGISYPDFNCVQEVGVTLVMVLFTHSVDVFLKDLDHD